MRLHAHIVRDGSSGLLVDGILVGLPTRPEEDAALDRRLAGATEQEDRFRLAIDMIPQIVWSTLPDGHHDYYNRRWYEFTGMEPGSTDGEGWAELFHPEDQERAWPLWRHSLATGEPYEVEYRLRGADGSYKWTLGRALPIRDAGGAIIRWFGTCTDIDDKKRLLENQELLSRELSHRIKNIFAVIGALIALSVRNRPQAGGFAAELKERIAALGRAHNYARPHSDESRPFDDEATLFGLLREIMAPYPQLEQGRITFRGDDVRVGDRAATPVSLLFHELATNAVKHGALSTPAGEVAISCARDERGQIRIVWQEHGGPRIETRPQTAGFGTRLAEMSVERQLGGSMQRTFPPEGFRFEGTIPPDSLSLPH
ncbi:PAS domain-containing protein [Allosphingosinicella sp.]|uniref:PAS domain-containing protein n=1 Tax=Allosphingosinicella sp. TaxID=2823234 RepID=UPI003D73D398